MVQVRNLFKNDFEDKLNKIIQERPKTKHRLEIKRIKEYMRDCSMEVPADGLEYAEDFSKFLLLQSTKGVEVRELFIKCLSEAKIVYDEKNLKRFSNKQLNEKLFFTLFDIYPSQGKEYSGQGENENQMSDVEPDTDFNKESYSLDISQMQQLYDAVKKIPQNDIDVTNFTLVDKMPVTLQDEFYLRIPESCSVYAGCAALAVCNTGNIAAIGTLQGNMDEMHMLFDAENINYDLFKKNRRFNVVLFPESQSEFFCQKFNEQQLKAYQSELYTVEVDIDFQRLESTSKTLCIDFGTSNTTAGSYGIRKPEKDDIELVEFLDVTQASPEVKKMMPTIVYVDSCSGGEVKYSFGYHAKKKIIDADYDTKASVFYEIKRWINDLGSEEEIFDDEGNKKTISHAEVVGAYLKYVIDLAEQYFKVEFKKLHFSAPVKLKDSFIQKISKLLPDYELVPAESVLDEGVSIIYHHVAKELREDTKNESQSEHHVLIMDCGGGTTDLASCCYSCEQLQVGKRLNIETSFENGNSNFGGNNITFRILQLLKIKIAAHRQGKEDLPVKTIMDLDESSILEKIDNWQPNAEKKSATDEIYASFNKAYQEAEAWIPTRFGDCNLKNDKRWMKRNYYYLWQMAETVKIEFYKSDLVAVNFDEDGDRKICISDMNQYYLYVRENADGKLVKYPNPMQNIKITINEIRRVIYADIYDLLSSLLNQYENHNDRDDKILNYNKLLNYYYKLSGQSCTITLFHDLLKEFIPGRLIRREKRGNAALDSSPLKLACIQGSIEYIRDLEYGEIKPEITTKQPKLIYRIFKLKDNEEKEVSLEGKDLKIDTFPLSVQRTKFEIRDKNGRYKNTILYEFNQENGQKCPLSDLELKLQHKTYLSKEELKGIISAIQDLNPKQVNGGDPIICLFMLPSRTGYGVHIYQVKVDDEDYYLQRDGQFESFEDESMETFFDGKR